MTEEQIEEFQKLAKAMMKFLCDNCNPHVTVIIEPTTAELLSGECAFVSTEFLKD